MDKLSCVELAWIGGKTGKRDYDLNITYLADGDEGVGN